MLQVVTGMNLGNFASAAAVVAGARQAAASPSIYAGAGESLSGAAQSDCLGLAAGGLPDSEPEAVFQDGIGGMLATANMSLGTLLAAYITAEVLLLVKMR